MSLQRYFPSPSDRMAIIWSLLSLEDAAVLEYGPAGTTHFGGGFYGNFGLPLSGHLFTTHISEDDVIMGDVSRLEKAIVEIDETYQPKLIFVVASAAVAVIGTDIRGVCRYMQQEVNARLVTFEDGGFRGDYTYGLRAVYKLLVKELAEEERQPEPGTFQILGASAGSYRIRSDVWEIKELMREAFGMECRLALGLETTSDKIAAAGNAELNLVLRCEALEAADYLREKYGTPSVYGVPCGYQGTLQWLQQIAEVIGRPVNPALAARLIEKTDDMVPMGGGPMTMLPRKPPRAVVQGDYDMIEGLSSALTEMGVTVIAKLSSHSLKALTDPDPQVKWFKEEGEKLAFCRELHECWILGDNVMPRCCPEDNYFTCVSFPFSGKPQIATHLPFVGEKGMDYLRECKMEYFDRFGM